jgi:hypothetical protein
MTNDLLRRFPWRVPGLKPLAFQRYFTGRKPGASTFAELKPSPASKLFCSPRSSALSYPFLDESKFFPCFTGGY